MSVPHQKPVSPGAILLIARIILVVEAWIPLAWTDVLVIILHDFNGFDKDISGGGWSLG